MEETLQPVMDCFTAEAILILVVLNRHEKGGPFTYTVSFLARYCIVPVDVLVDSKIPVLTFRGSLPGFQRHLQNMLEQLELAKHTPAVMRLILNLHQRWRRKNQRAA